MPLLPPFICVCLYMQRVKVTLRGLSSDTIHLFYFTFEIRSLTGLELVVQTSQAGQQAPITHLSPTARTGITTIATAFINTLTWSPS